MTGQHGARISLGVPLLRQDRPPAGPATETWARLKREKRAAEDSARLAVAQLDTVTERHKRDLAIILTALDSERSPMRRQRALELICAAYCGATNEGPAAFSTWIAERRAFAGV